MDPRTTTTATVSTTATVRTNHARVMESVRRGMSNASTRVSANAKIVAATYNTASELHEKNRENERQIVSLKRELVELQDDRARVESDMLTRLAELHAEKVAMEEEMEEKVREGQDRIERLLEERRVKKQGGGGGNKRGGGLFRSRKKRGAGSKDRSHAIDENGSSNADAESSIADDDEEASSTGAAATSEKDGTVRGCNSFESDYDATYDCRAIIAPSPSHGSYDSNATATTLGTDASYYNSYHMEHHRQNHGTPVPQSERVRGVLASLGRLRVAIISASDHSTGGNETSVASASASSELEFLEGEMHALLREAEADVTSAMPRSSVDPVASHPEHGLDVEEGEETTEGDAAEASPSPTPWYAEEEDEEEESGSTCSSPTAGVVVARDGSGREAGNDRDVTVDDPTPWYAEEDDEEEEVASISLSPTGVVPRDEIVREANNDQDATVDDPVVAGDDDDDDDDVATDSSKTKKAKKKKKGGVKKGIGRAFGGGRTKNKGKLIPSSSKSKLSGTNG